VQPQSYRGRGLSRMTLVLHLFLLGCLGGLTIVPLVMGGAAARGVALLAGVGWVLAIGVLVHQVAKRGGSLKIAPDLMAFGGERIYLRDIESVERGRPDRSNQTFRVEVRTRERVHHLDLMDYCIEGTAMPALLDGLRHAVARGRGEGSPSCTDESSLSI